MCFQGINGKFSHTGVLAFAVDFDISVGTRVLAARGGVVASLESQFRKGAPRKELKVKSNFVSIRHDDGTYARYYHLKHRGVKVKVGETVEVGQWIGLSGNTGYTTGPHLHFDVVDMLPSETCEVMLVRKWTPAFQGEVAAGAVEVAAERKSREEECEGSHPGRRGTGTRQLMLPCANSAVAAFSCELPALDSPMERDLVVADPLCADRDLKAEDVRGRIVLVMRCGVASFVEKAQRVEKAGGAACIIINSGSDEIVHVMAGGLYNTVSIPTIMVPPAWGNAVLDHAKNFHRLGGAAAGQHFRVSLQRSPHFREMKERGEFALLKAPRHPDVSPYVPVTLPVRFYKGKTREVMVPGIGCLDEQGNVLIPWKEKYVACKVQ